VDTRAAGAEDDFTKTVSYADLSEIAVEIATKRRFKLIEALAEAIAAEILGRLALVAAIVVRVDKPSAPVPAVIEGVSVEIERKRNG
jgi:dihydroneopterin aldolase